MDDRTLAVNSQQTKENAMMLNAQVAAVQTARVQEPKKVNPAEAPTLWNRVKAWTARAYRKATGVARRVWTRLSSAVKAHVVTRTSLKVARQVAGTVAAAAPYVLRSLRSFARTCLALVGAAAWLTAFLAAPVAMLFATFAVLGATAAIAAVLGWLDARNSAAARFVLVAIDTVARVVGVAMEVAMGVLAVAAVAATRPALAIPQLLAFTAWTSFDATQRKRVSAQPTQRPSMSRPASVEVEASTARGRVGRDPFARASSRVAIASASR
jgi:hypothetical protein